MKIVHTADWHAGCHTYGHWDGPFHTADKELADCLNEIVPSDLLLIAGDVYDKHSPGPSERTVISQYLFGRRTPTVIIPGNHDHQKVHVDALMPEVQVQLAGFNTISTVPFFVVREPSLLNLYIKEHTVLVLAVPWTPNLEELVQSVDRIYAQRQAFKILVTHAPVRGADLNVYGTPCLHGIPQNVVDKWSKMFDYVALGDLHVHQYAGSWNNVCYSGSPRCLDFKDTDTAKGYNALHVDSDRNFKISFKKCKSARTFVNLHIKEGKDLRELESEDLSRRVFRAFIYDHAVPTHEVEQALQSAAAFKIEFVRKEQEEQPDIQAKGQSDQEWVRQYAEEQGEKDYARIGERLMDGESEH